MQKLDFENELSKFENPNFRTFTETLINEFPSYYWTVPASSSGKYHPAQDVLNHGLVYHTKAVCNMLEHLMAPEAIHDRMNSEERDCCRCACLVHDGWKSGDIKEDGTYEDHTVFDHPLIAQKHILAHKDDGIITDDAVNLIGELVSSHMGQWNTSKYAPGIELPKPTSDLQILVHMADYLASRKDIITIEPYYAVRVTDSIADQTEEAIDKITQATAEDYVIKFGIHDGEKYLDVRKTDPNYLMWIFNKSRLPDDLRNIIMNDFDNIKASIRSKQRYAG